ncbi:MAG: alkaline phosphatase D family protein [Alphaproteobacteria bacterium]|nr:alkaline phosphatase D family protein [Alphaproteobacteria bacterium]
MALLLLALLACKDDTISHSGVGESGTEAPVDADGDGVTSDLDCDDADPARAPGLAEACDGVDQDCDGAVDEGVPNDGRGCFDPGRPAAPALGEVLHITARTGPNTTNGTDEAMEVCLSEGQCWSLNKPDWNDLETGEIDVIAYEGLSLDPAGLDRFTVRTSGGADQWRPQCFQVSVDGEPRYCRAVEDLPIGNEGDELSSWTDPEGLGEGCDTCFDSVLTHGPILGPLTPESARIWLRLDRTRRVALRVANRGEDLDAAPELGVSYPAAADDFAQLISVYGLLPDTRYVYAIEVDGARVGTWELTTPPEDAETLRLAFGSCTKDAEQPIFGAIAATNPDAFLFIGDNHYGNTDDLSALRQWYRWAHERPLRAELMMDTPIYATWDDHDYVGNNTDGSASGRGVALRVFEEYWANGRYGSEAAAGVYSTHRLGPVELVLLDDRYHRGNDGTLLGEAQTQWLLDTLEASDAPFKLLACGSQFTLDGSSDSWANFPDAQAALLEAIATRGISGVVLLSGDIHRSELRWVPGAEGGYDLPELTSSPLANVNSSCHDDAGLVSCVDDRTSFVLIEVDAGVEDPTLVAEIRDEAGAVLGSLSVTASQLGAAR